MLSPVAWLSTSFAVIFKWVSILPLKTLILPWIVVSFDSLLVFSNSIAVERLLILSSKAFTSSVRWICSLWIASALSLTSCCKVLVKFCILSFTVLIVEFNVWVKALSALSLFAVSVLTLVPNSEYKFNTSVIDLSSLSLKELSAFSALWTSESILELRLLSAVANSCLTDASSAMRFVISVLSALLKVCSAFVALVTSLLIATVLAFSAPLARSVSVANKVFKVVSTPLARVSSSPIFVFNCASTASALFCSTIILFLFSSIEESISDAPVSSPLI